MASSRRPLVVLVSVWLFVTFIFIPLGNCHASPTTAAQVFRPKYMQNSGHFLGFFPRRIPIPASGPSRKHNGIGLRSWRSP
ncbi:hypothetical protein C1H46_035303 [Malus baccata]|uniref:Protein IDA-LIKE 2 n=1 Tax=Malus baccata TaxID=106549 RepID=A0A540KY37_MALBA|nr:hypothetical protein C1H46_035303 [Malus baccata]